MELHEIIPILLLLLSGIAVLIFLGTRETQRKKRPVTKTVTSEPAIIKEKSTKGLGPGFGIFESFDYNGTKILNTDGVFTILDGGRPQVYDSLEKIPSKYRKMMLEIDDCKSQPVQGKYFLENLNGKYFVRFPDGRKKKYKAYADIPDRIKKVMV